MALVCDDHGGTWTCGNHSMDDKGSNQMTNKKQYDADKKIKELYRSLSDPGETYSDFKRKKKFSF